MGEWLLNIVSAVIVAAVVAWLALWRESRRLEAEHEARLARLREEMKLEYATETAIRRLLGESGWELRSLDAIRRHIRGFDDDALRRHLVRAGAIAFEDADGVEKWGLLEKNATRLARKEPEA